MNDGYDAARERLVGHPGRLHLREDVLGGVFETMLSQGVRELPVTDAAGALIGFVDETSIAHAYVAARDRKP